MVGVEKAAILLTTLGPEAAAGVFRQLSEPEVRQLSAAIARLRSIPREQAAAVLAALPEDLQPEIAQRIADLQSVPEDLLADVGDVLAGQVQGLGRVAPRAGFLGAKLVADILNVADEAVEARVFAHLEAHA